LESLDRCFIKVAKLFLVQYRLCSIEEDYEKLQELGPVLTSQQAKRLAKFAIELDDAKALSLFLSLS
jgi:hypothetical protein